MAVSSTPGVAATFAALIDAADLITVVACASPAGGYRLG
jgi:hypothetical protein